MFPAQRVPFARRPGPAFALLALALLSPTAALATWPHSYGGVTLTNASGTGASAATDGAGGMIVAWVDTRNGNSDIYARRVDANGTALWASGGVAVCTAAQNQINVKAVEDGAGGVYIAWEDHRNDPANADIYAQHLDANGNVAGGWPANGFVLCTAASDQGLPAMASDHTGGAFVAWHDYRNPGNGADVYLQHVTSSGLVAGWPPNGLAICVVAGDQGPVRIANDGSTGVYLAWHDGRNSGSTGYDIYAQHVLGNAQIPWVGNGVPVCTASGFQTLPVLAPDASGGVNVAWNDYRNFPGSDIYATNLGPGGTTNWFNGRVVAFASGDQINPAIVQGNQYESILIWEDHRGSDADIYGDVIWAGAYEYGGGAGVPLCTAGGDQNTPVAVSDGAGGAIAAWTDYRGNMIGPNRDIFAQRLSSSGRALWASQGLRVTQATNDEDGASLAPDASGGALVAYSQAISTNWLVLAQRLDHWGALGNPEPLLTRIKDAPSDQGGIVNLSWNASYLDVDPSFGISSYQVWRRLTTTAAQQALARGARLLREGEAPAGGPAIRTIGAGVSAQSWLYLGAVPARGYSSYSFPAPTAQDSMAGAPGWSVFMVDAEAASAPGFFSSKPDSGYSVDNLAPAMPGAFLGQYSSGVTHLHWARNGETDFVAYHLYRGANGSFTPSPSNLISDQPDTGYDDPGPAGSWYKLAAMDAHGNTSAYAVLAPSQTTSVPGVTAPLLALAGVLPNPVRGEARVSLTLPRAMTAKLAVLDAAGRVVRTLFDGPLAAGTQDLRWDGRDRAGRRLAAGLYFVRLDTTEGVRVRRVAVIE